MPDNQNTNGEGYFKGNIDARVSSLERNVEKIMTNHLPHLQEKLDRIEWWLVVSLGTLVIGLLYIILEK